MDTMKEYFPRLLKSRSFVIYGIIIIVMIIAIFAGSGNLIVAYQSAEQNRAKINEIETFLAKFSEQKRYLEDIEEKPIKASELDAVQTEIFKEIKDYNLNLIRFNATDNSGTKEKNRDFNLSISGKYSSVMLFLKNFHAKNALMNIKMLELKPKKDEITADLTYTVYIK